MQEKLINIKIFCIKKSGRKFYSRDKINKGYI